MRSVLVSKVFAFVLVPLIYLEGVMRISTPEFQSILKSLESEPPLVAKMFRSVVCLCVSCVAVSVERGQSECAIPKGLDSMAKSAMQVF